MRGWVVVRCLGREACGGSLLGLVGSKRDSLKRPRGCGGDTEFAEMGGRRDAGQGRSRNVGKIVRTRFSEDLQVGGGV